MRFQILFVLIAFMISGVASAEIKNTEKELSYGYSIDDKEFIFKRNKYPERKETLSRDELQYDIAFLIAAFERAYSGREHLPPDIYDKLVKDVYSLGEEVPLGATSSDGKLFCMYLADIFRDVPDNHLFVYGGECNRVRRHKESEVGKNIYSGRGHHYEIRIADGRRIGLLSLGTEMPGSGDSSWKGLEEKIANIFGETDALIIDLRGNQGGVSYNIRWLASFLYGNPAKMLDEVMIMRATPAFFALLHNEPAMRIVEDREANLPVQQYLVNEREKNLKKFKMVGNDFSKQFYLVRRGSDDAFNPQRGYNKPIRILIDGTCASACEGGYPRFLSHPHVRTYGTNTMGTYHYGDNKPLVLPKSNVVVSIPTSYRAFPDGRFIEKIGYSPDVLVPTGDDALEVALKDLVKDRKVAGLIR